MNTGPLEAKLRALAEAKMIRASDELRRDIEVNAPRDTGALAASPVTYTTVGERYITSKVVVDRKSPTGFDVATAQEEGTGVYAGRGRIYPVRAKRLTFFWSKIGAVVSFASVKGTPPTRFFSNAIAQWKDRLAGEYQ